MNICMKIGLGLNFFTNYRRANKAKFCKDNSKVKHSFFFDNGPFIGGGYRLNKYFVGRSMVPQKQ